MNRIKFTHHEGTGILHLIFALLLMLAGIALIIAGFSCWPRAVFGIVSALAGLAIIADLIAKRKKSDIWDGPFHDELSNRLYYASRIVKTKCLLCGKDVVFIKSPRPGSECPECGPVFFDLIKDGFYGQAAKEALRIKTEGRHG
jgi:hypothetical protein